MVHDSADDRIPMASFWYSKYTSVNHPNYSSAGNSNADQRHEGGISELIELLVRSDYFNDKNKYVQTANSTRADSTICSILRQAITKVRHLRNAFSGYPSIQNHWSS